MFDKYFRMHLFAAALSLAAPSACLAQQPSASPPPPEKQEPAPVRIYTEEVILPVVAYDSNERFDPTLEAGDVLVLENGVPQQVRSVRHAPANIILLFDMAGAMTETRSMNLAREAALKAVARLRQGDEVAVINNSTRVELLADWTADSGALTRVIETKVLSSNRSRLSRCLLMAADKLKEKPPGSAHVFIFTDGVESQSDQTKYELAVSRVASTQAVAHVITYSALARKAVKNENSNLLDLDFPMKRWRRKYAAATEANDERLAALVGQLGGRVLIPATDAEAARQADEAANEIGSQYVVTYRPKQPFAGTDERRRVGVVSRRVGLRLIAMRDYVTPPGAGPVP